MISPATPPPSPPHAAAAGVRLALEPLNPMFGSNRTCLFTVAETLALCDAVGAPNVGIAVDDYHLWSDTTLARSLADARGRVLGYTLATGWRRRQTCCWTGA